MIPPWWRSQARTGDILTVKAMPRGARSYLDLRRRHRRAPVVLGSRSTQFRSASSAAGTDGRSVPGDILPCTASTASIGELGVEPAEYHPCAAERVPDETVVRVVIAGEYDGVRRRHAGSASGRSSWKITPQSNRLRLPPARLRREAERADREALSRHRPRRHPDSAERTAHHPDARRADVERLPRRSQTVIRADLWRVGQARLGGKLRFEQTAYTDALAAEAEMSAYLDRLQDQRVVLSRRSNMPIETADIAGVWCGLERSGVDAIEIEQPGQSPEARLGHGSADGRVPYACRHGQSAGDDAIIAKADVAGISSRLIPGGTSRSSHHRRAHRGRRDRRPGQDRVAVCAHRGHRPPAPSMP